MLAYSMTHNFQDYRINIINHIISLSQLYVPSIAGISGHVLQPQERPWLTQLNWPSDLERKEKDKQLLRKI